MAKLEIQLGADSSELLAGLNKSEQALKQWVNRLRGISSGLNFQGLKNDLAAVNNELAKQRAATEAARTATQSQRAETERFRTEQARLRAEIDALRLATAQNKQQTTAAAGSYREAQQRLAALGREIRNAAGGFNSMNPAIQAQIEAYRQLNAQLTAFDRNMGNNQRNVGNYQGALGGFANSLQGVIAGYFSIQAAIGVTTRIVKSNAEISDSLADVRRTAGLTAREAENLGKALKSLDTRSSLKELLDIATIGGQLGISKTQLVGFTKAVDQLAVALGGELQGGAEGIAKSLGVLDNVFGITRKNAGDVNRSFNQIGSAILGLGQSGLATGDFLADFGERVGGVAKQAGIALPVVLSYGAVLQEAGVSAEVAGTAFKRLISALGSKTVGFFNVAKLADANLTLKEFSTLVNTDTKKALDLFFAGLNKGGESTIAFNTILKDLKLSGSGVSQVVAALSQGQESLNGHIRDATRDFNDASLAADQFKIKNDNLAGSLDKLSNAFTNLTTNPDHDVAKFLKFIADAARDFINDIGNADSKLRKFLSYTPTGLIWQGIGKISEMGSVGGYINGTPVSPSEWRKYQASLQAAQEQQNAVIATKTTKLVNESTGEADLLKKIGNEQARLNSLRSREKEQKQELIRRLDVLNEMTKAGANYTAEQKQQAINNKEAIKNQWDATNEKIKEQKLFLIALRGEYDRLYAVEKKRADTGAPEVFGKKGKITDEEKQANRIADVYKNLNAELQSNPFKLNTTIFSLAKDNVSSYEKALQALIKLGIKPTSDEIKALKTNIDELGQVINSQTLAPRVGFRADFKPATINQNVNRNVTLTPKENDEISGYITRQIRSSISNVISDTLGALTQIGQKNREIEQKYSDLRRDATTDQIALYNELERLEKSVATGLLSTISNVFQSLSKGLNDIFIKAFSEKLTNMIKETDLNIGGLSKQISTALVAGAGLAGSLLSGIASPTSKIGQGLGGALSGLGTGGAIGSAIGGPVGGIIGAIGGGLIGAIGGIFGAGKRKKEEELQRQQVELQKQQLEEQKRANALAYSSSIIGQMTNQGIITGVDRDAYGNIVGRIEGKDLVLIIDRQRNSR